MIAGLLSAVVACLAYGVSSVLQAYGAYRSARIRRSGAQVTAGSGAPSLASTVAAALTGWFILGTVLDVVGFLGGGAAARLIPLRTSSSPPCWALWCWVTGCFAAIGTRWPW